MGLGRKVSSQNMFLTNDVTLSGMDMSRFSPKDLSFKYCDTTLRALSQCATCCQGLQGRPEGNICQVVIAGHRTSIERKCS